MIIFYSIAAFILIEGNQNVAFAGLGSLFGLKSSTNSKISQAEADYNTGHHIVFDNETGDFSEGIKLLEKAARTGHIGATSALGFCYLAGRGVKEDPAKAREYLERGVAAGDGYAQFYLGTERSHGGKVCSKDIRIAEDLLKKSAEQDWTMAQLNLGVLYTTEDYGRPTADEGRKWLTKAAVAGDMHAQKFLGLIYADGIQTQRDLNAATPWFRQAADQGDRVSMYYLFIISCNQPEAVSVPDGLTWLSRAAAAGLEKAISTQQQLMHEAEDKDTLTAIEEADRRRVQSDPFYAAGKRLREGITSNTLSGQDVAQAALAFGIAVLANHFQRQQEEKQWVHGVEHRFYYDQQSGGIVVTNQPVDILPNPFFPSVRPVR